MTELEQSFFRPDADMGGLIDENEFIEFMKESWTAAGGANQEPPEWKAARLKAIKSLNLDNREQFSWENFERSYQIMSIWLEKGKARAEMREVMRDAMKLAPKEMRSMIEFALNIEEEQEK